MPLVSCEIKNNIMLTPPDKHGEDKLLNKRYPILLITIMLCSYLAPLLDNDSLADGNTVDKTSSRSSSCIGDVCISEVLVNAFGSETGSVGPSDWTTGEWVELHNSGTTTVDLSTWALADHYSRPLSMTTSHVVYPSGATNLDLAAGDYIVLARNGDGGSCGFCLKNSNGMVNLSDASGQLVHTISWTSSPTEGVSLIQDATNPTADWVESATLSPGEANQGGTPVGPVYFASELLINEVMADASPSFDNATYPGGEWIEIYNQGQTAIDLTGWYVSDAAGNIVEFDENHLIDYSSNPDSLMINPDSTRIIAINGSTNSGVLNNAVEKLRIHWPNGTIGDEVNWTSTEPGFSLSRISGSDSMYMSAYPTINQTNLAPMENLPAASSEVYITEYLPSTNTSGDFPDGKWIEIYNNGINLVDLSGWSVINGKGDTLYLDPGTMVFNQSHSGVTEINPGERRLVGMSNSFDLYDYYEHLVLKDNSNSVVDSGWHGNYFGDNVSMVRDLDALGSAWVPSNWMTPGEPEPGTEPYIAADVMFTEVLPDSEGLDTQSWPRGEWIEVYNNDTTAVDLTGWKLKASNSRSFTIGGYNLPLQSDAIIQPGDVGLIALNGTNSFYLKQTTDIITLVDVNMGIVDTVSWNHSSENVSLVAPGSSHAGYTNTTPDGISGWVEPAWATPGVLNPQWPAYTASNSIILTEYVGWCDMNSNNYDDWIEVFNNGTEPIDLSRWRLDTDNQRFFVTELSTQSNTDQYLIAVNTSMSTIVNAGEYALVSLPRSYLMPIDTIALYNPDGILISQANSHGEGVTPSTCDSWISTDGENWYSGAYPTPGVANIQATDFATAQDIVITRVSPYNNEFIQIKNIGLKDAFLNGWTININDGILYECTIMNNMFFSSQSSIVFAEDTDITGSDGMSEIIQQDINYLSGPATTYLSFDDVGCSGLYLPDSGVAISLKDSNGDLGDTFVYDSGPASQEGWSSESISIPSSNVASDEFVYVRGDGCSFLPDTNTAGDWQYQWSTTGAMGTVCLQTIFDEAQSLIVPVTGPQYGLLELKQFIDDSQTSLRIQLYQLQDAYLVQALLDAIQRGVSVELMLDPGCNNCNIWSETDLQYKNDFAYTLIQAGATVYEFNTGSNEPYLYLHSKVVVRDLDSIWISSGNWKSSSIPAPGVRGNVEWSIIIENPELAGMVNQQFNLDIYWSEEMSLSDYDAYTFNTPDSIGGGGVQSTIQASIAGELVTCPENCVGKITDFIRSADSEVLLSQQTLDVDWSYGWGDENPIISALHDVATDGVSVHLIINGAYLDDDDQEVVDLFNEVWNGSEGLDTSAIVMSEDDDVSKLHNKGIIVDQESVLVSSINMGSSAMNRNREMGVIIHSPIVTQFYLDGWHADWMRLDNVTDTDQDTLTDKWEVANGLNRTKRIMPSGITEDMFDADGDGVNNTDEEKQGSHPLLPDTDGDCAIDSAEIAWAQSTALDSSVQNVAIYDALNLADADGDGVKDTDLLGCDLASEIIIPEPIDNETIDPDADDDNDGVANKNDLCPETVVGGLTDPEGCSSEQLAENADASDGEKDTSGSDTMLIVMLIAAIFTAGAFLILKQLESRATEAKNLVSLEEQEMMLMETADSVDTGEWSAPVLDGSSQPTTSDVATQTIDVSKFPGWSEDIIQRYLDSGWTIEQLAEYYQEQVNNNQ